MRLAVVYSSDENYVQLTAVSMVSLLEHHEAGSVHVYLLANDVGQESLQFLRQTAEQFGGIFTAIDVRSRLETIASTGAGSYVSYSAYARFFISDLVPYEDRIVYLDCDTLVVDSLTGLLSLDLNGKAFAIAYDCLRNEYKKLIGLTPERPYFNSGVLVVDLKAWRVRKCTERVFEHMKNVRASYMFGDQDFFSVVLHEDAARLPVRYNFLTHYLMFRRHHDVLSVMGIPPEAWADKADFDEAIARPAVYHFLGQTLGRPWFRESRNPLRPTYVEYARKAGVQSLTDRSRPMELCYRLQERLWKLLPRSLFVLACRCMYRYYFWSAYKV